MAGCRRVLFVFVVLTLSFGLLGAQCGGGSPTSSSTPGTNSSATPSPAPTNPAGTTQVQTGAFFASPLPAAGVTTYLHQASSFTSECSIPYAAQNPSTLPSGNSTNDISCILDGAEGDLHFNGMTVNFNAPPGMCTYVWMKPYWFWTYPVGGPSAVAYCVSAASGNSGTILTVTQDGGGGVNPKTGQYTCLYDYSGDGGPNCCEGNYNLAISTSVDGTVGNCTNPQTSSVAYGGLIGNCTEGPGDDFAGVLKNSSNIPTGIYYDTLVSGVNVTVPIVSPNSKKFGTNLYVASYFDPANNSGNPPTSLQAQDGVLPQQYYELDCLDAGWDTLARIRLSIRSWDTVAGFTAQSNPYTNGNQSGFNNNPWHNFSIWQDLESGYLDSTN